MQQIALRVTGTIKGGFKAVPLRKFFYMTTFEGLGLDAKLLKAVDALGFTQPTPIQEKAIPVLLSGTRDLVGLAQTGTGKTAAMKRALVLAALGEVATGLALLIVPSLVGRLLLGEELTGIAIPVARVAGIALIGLGVACWPGPPRVGMLIYSGAVALYLAYLGFAGGLGGIFLWPAVVLHLILTVLLIRVSPGEKQKTA